MRAFAFALVASLALAACAAPPAPAASARDGRPQRVVSLNLCTDELLLLLADPGQIASVTHLAHSEAEFALWREAQAFPSNDGTLASAAAMRPDLVLTMGAAGSDRLGIGGRLGIAVHDVAPAQSLDEVVTTIRSVAAALHQSARGEALVARIETLRRAAPSRLPDGLWVAGGGRTAAPQGLHAEWLALAGVRQRAVSGNLIQLEQLLTSPPDILVRSDYRGDQYSSGQAWLTHPLAAARPGSRTVNAEGRRWTCLGPLLIDEVERLRTELAT